MALDSCRGKEKEIQVRGYLVSVKGRGKTGKKQKTTQPGEEGNEPLKYG